MPPSTANGCGLAMKEFLIHGRGFDYERFSRNSETRRRNKKAERCRLRYFYDEHYWRGS
jgi:hypothetical protein